MMRQMANSGSTSQSEHGSGPLTTGSSNVLVNGGNAWRAQIDIFTCPVHGPEVVPFGHTHVLVNGMMATSIGDFLLGAGPPDIIRDTPANNVYIGGAEGVGLDSEAGIAEWCNEWCKFENLWDKRTPDERRQAYDKMVGRMFSLFGAPPPNVIFEPPATNTGGYINVVNGDMGVGSQYFTATSAGNLRRVTYHEVRHGEQLFNGMRYARQQAKDGHPILGDNTAAKNAAMVNAADKLGGFPPGSKEEAFARTMAHGYSTDQGLDQLRWANKDYHNRYTQIPGGYDADRTEGKPAGACKC